MIDFHPWSEFEVVLSSFQLRAKEDPEDRIKIIELKKCIEALLKYPNTSPIPCSLFKATLFLCIHCYNNEDFNTYMHTCIKPALKDLMNERTAKVKQSIRDTLSVMFTPEVHDLDKEEVQILGAVCEDLLESDLCDKTTIYQTLLPLITKQKQETRRAIIEPYKPSRHHVEVTTTFDDKHMLYYNKVRSFTLSSQEKALSVDEAALPSGNPRKGHKGPC